MEMEPSQTVETLGPCTKDVRDCEIVRAAIILKSVEQDNEHAQQLRLRLAQAACDECLRCYLPAL